MSAADRDVKEIGSAILVVVVLVITVGAIITGVYGSGAPASNEISKISGGTADIDQFVQQQPQVNQSLGDAAQLDANSSLSSGADVDVSGNWTLTTHVRLNSSVDLQNDTRRVIRVDDFVYLDYAEGNWRATYYDDSSLNTYQVNLSAVNATSFNYLEVSKNATHLRIQSDNSRSNSVALADGQSVGNLSADPLIGAIDETRLYDAQLTANQSQTLYQRPTAPLPANQEFRIMYDSFSDNPSSFDVFRADGSLSATGVDTTNGLQGGGAVRGTDYEVDLTSAQLSTKDGGTLDGAPAAYVTYTGSGSPWPALIVQIYNAIQGVFGILLVAILAMAGARVMDMMEGDF